MLMHFLDPVKFGDPEAVAHTYSNLGHQEQVVAHGGGGPRGCGRQGRGRVQRGLAQRWPLPPTSTWGTRST